MTKFKGVPRSQSAFRHSYFVINSSFELGHFAAFASRPESPEVRVMPQNVKTVPRHIAIIMDGNGRWAKARGLPRVAGHRRGADAVRRVVRGAGELGIPILTLFAFSTENWTRPADEVADLMVAHPAFRALKTHHGHGSLPLVTHHP